MRHIPPVQCLVTFEALARLRHAGRTAEELSVTPSAVSHRIRQLEANVGFKLFGRNDFNLTADGSNYLANVRIGLAALMPSPRFERVDRNVQLRLAVTPTFSRQFLMPRLELFRNLYPEVDLVLQVSIPLLDVTAEPPDLEIRYGAGGYADRDFRPILSEKVVPACSPGFLHEYGPFTGFRTTAEIDSTRLIRSPLEPWNTWFASCGLGRAEPRLGSQFNDLGLVYDAAASGFGVALVRLKMASAWLEAGRLVPLSEHAVLSPHRHYLCWQRGTLERWECAAFVDWLTRALV